MMLGDLTSIQHMRKNDTRELAQEDVTSSVGVFLSFQRSALKFSIHYFDWFGPSVFTGCRHGVITMSLGVSDLPYKIHSCFWYSSTCHCEDMGYIKLCLTR